ncbi:MAG: uroporphyrinogen-III synthase [Planctomycetaceae bacterium]|nr:uroporphyrinogen-III synthase [Planctomycetaceae bacterium]
MSTAYCKQPVVCSFESRRAEEMGALIRRHGGEPVVAPSMKDFPLEENPVAERCLHQIIDGQIPIIVFQTGIGAEALLKLAELKGLLAESLNAFQTMTVVARGPKPVAVLHRFGIRCDVRAGEPNTWRELLSAIDTAELDLQGHNVAVQEYGIPNTRLSAGLEERGALVIPVPVYAWALPDDPGPLQEAIQRVIEGTVKILLFTSANQVANVLSVADSLGSRNAFLEGARHCFVASVGPTCSETLVESGFHVAFEASPPKMAVLVRGAIDSWIAAERV